MSTPEITRSMLVNQGLSARLPFDLAQMADDSAPADVVGSFKQIVGDRQLSVVDQELVASIAAITSPLDLATYFINAKYAELGGTGGSLGTTTSAVSATAKGAGFMRAFQRGAIYWQPQIGAHEIHGPIRVRWLELGGESGFLGFPTTDITAGTDVRSEGFFAHFQGGSIYWAPPPLSLGILSGSVLPISLSAEVATRTSSVAAPQPALSLASAVTMSAAPAQNGLLAMQQPLQVSDQARGRVADTNLTVAGTAASTVARVGAASTIAGVIKDLVETSAGAFEVHGVVREKYLALGAEASILGYPRTDETGTPDGVGRFNHFQSGSIYWTPGTFAHEVHGLIRDRWASLGWERNPQLGYPITDELIPDPRIGHRRPEARKKPVLSMPSDVIKLPVDAAAAGFPLSVVNTVLTPAMQPIPVPNTTTIRATATLATNSISGAVGRLSDRALVLNDTNTVSTRLPASATVDTAIAVAILTAAASTPADQRSVNRFADFENGVLFWFRGTTSASTLSALAATSDGTPMSFSGADVAAATVAKIGKAAFETGNAQLLSMTFVGTTGYSFDGAQVHNRRHRLQLILQGIETQLISGPLGSSISIPAPVTATIELQVEVWFDASQRQIVLAPTDWLLTQASSGSYANAISADLHAKLDPVLWRSFELITLPDTDGGTPIAVLSVKTLPNGVVSVFVEPQKNHVLGSLSELANAVTPSVFVFSQPN
jgi:hypothetical protein